MAADEFGVAVEKAAREQVIADLKAARAELVTRGRSEVNLVQWDGKVCALGAIGVATVDGFVNQVTGEQRVTDPYGLFDEPRPRRAIEALAAVTATSYPDLPYGRQRTPITVVYVANDNGAATDQDILNLFDKTLAELGGMA